MARPRIDADTLDRLDASVDERTRVPASHLTADEQLSFVLDQLDEAERRIARLSDRVEELEDELEAARATTDDASERPDASEIANADLPEELANKLGDSRRRR
jgi:chromosome segregation ATPase